MDRIAELRKHLNGARNKTQLSYLHAGATLYTLAIASLMEQVANAGEEYLCMAMVGVGAATLSYLHARQSRTTALSTIATHLRGRRGGQAVTAQDAAAWLKLQKKRSRDLRQPAEDLPFLSTNSDAFWGDVVHERI